MDETRQSLHRNRPNADRTCRTLGLAHHRSQCAPDHRHGPAGVDGGVTGRQAHSASVLGARMSFPRHGQVDATNESCSRKVDTTSGFLTPCSWSSSSAKCAGGRQANSPCQVSSSEIHQPDPVCRRTAEDRGAHTFHDPRNQLPPMQWRYKAESRRSILRNSRGSTSAFSDAPSLWKGALVLVLLLVQRHGARLASEPRRCGSLPHSLRQWPCPAASRKVRATKKGLTRLPSFPGYSLDHAGPTFRTVRYVDRQRLHTV